MPNNERKFKINFLDFLLIILIIAIVSAAIVSVFRSNPNRISGGDHEITYTIKCEMVNAEVAKNITTGDNVYDNETNQLLGTVEAIPTVTPIYAVEYQTASGGSVPVEVPTDLVTLTFVVKAQVWENDGRYSVDNYDIIEGKTIVFHSEHLSLSGTCASISVIK